jgi:class 3 adenylate cyclase
VAFGDSRTKRAITSSPATAARLTSVARDGEIIVDAATYDESRERTPTPKRNS